MKNQSIPKTDQTLMVLRLAATIGAATCLMGCTTTPNTSNGYNGYNPLVMAGAQGYSYRGQTQNYGNTVTQSVLRSAQNATRYPSLGPNGFNSGNFDSKRFLNNLTRNVENQLLGNLRSTNIRNNRYSPNRYNNYDGYNAPFRHPSYNPDPAHRQAFLERRAANRYNTQTYRNNTMGAYRPTASYSQEPIYKRLPNGQFVQIN